MNIDMNDPSIGCESSTSLCQQTPTFLSFGSAALCTISLETASSDGRHVGCLFLCWIELFSDCAVVITSNGFLQGGKSTWSSKHSYAIHER